MSSDTLTSRVAAPRSDETSRVAHPCDFAFCKGGAAFGWPLSVWDDGDGREVFPCGLEEVAGDDCYRGRYVASWLHHARDRI